MSAPSLTALLHAYRSYTEADAAPEVAATFAREAERMAEPGWLPARARVGDRAPDVVLSAAGEPVVTLADRLRDGPVVVKFFRGRWCPYCTLDLRAWQRALPEIRARGARLVAVTPQGEHEIALHRERDRLEFPIVADAGNRIARAFGVAYALDAGVRALYERAGITAAQVDPTGDWTVPLPATYLIGPDGRIAFAHLDTDYRRRAEPGDVIAAIDRGAAEPGELRRAPPQRRPLHHAQ